MLKLIGKTVVIFATVLVLGLGCLVGAEFISNHQKEQARAAKADLCVTTPMTTEAEAFWKSCNALSEDEVGAAMGRKIRREIAAQDKR